MSQDLITRVVEQHLTLVERAGMTDVVDADTADVAGRLLMEVRSVIEQIHDARMAITRPLDEAKGRAIEQERAALRPYEEAKQALDGAILGYALREQARIDAERVEAEVRAQTAAAEGRFEEAAEAVLEREALPEKVHRAAGTQMRETWSAEVDDPAAFIAYCLANPVLVSQYLSINEKALGAAARAMKKPSPFPGIIFHNAPVLASTSAR